MTNLKSQNQIVLFPCIITFLFINLYTLKDGHNWGDDFSQYILHAKNISSGESYSKGLSLDAWVVCSPGFPLILSPLVKGFGVNFKVFKFLNVFFWLFFVFFLYRLIKSRLSKEYALLGAILFLFSYYFFLFKQNVLSDVPFLFFVTASLYYLDQCVRPENTKQREKKYFVVVLAMIFLISAILVRFAGLMLALSAVTYFLFFQRNWRMAGMTIAAAVSVYFIQSLFQTSFVSHLGEVNFSFSGWLHIAFLNISYTLMSIVAFFVPSLTILSKFSVVLDRAVFFLSPVFFVWLIYFIFIRIKKGRVSFLEWYFYLYFLSLIFWPIIDGVRYVFPIIGLVYIFAVEGTIHLSKKVEARKVVLGLVSFIICINIISILTNFNFDDDEVYRPQTKEMFSWVKENTPADGRFLFRQPRVFGLFTERQAATHWYRPAHQDKLVERVKKYQVGYLVHTNSSDEFLIKEGRFGPLVFDLLWQNESYKVFKIKNPS